MIEAIDREQPAAIGLDMYMPEVDQTSPDQVALSLRERAPELARQLAALPSNDALLAGTLSRTPSVLVDFPVK